MDAASTDLPDDVKTLQAMIVALQEREVRLRHIIAQLQGWRFGPRSEKLSVDQYDLALEDREIACAEADALADQSEETASQITGKRRANRSGDNRTSVPAHLPHIEEGCCPTRPDVRAVVAHCTRSIGTSPGGWTRSRRGTASS